MVVFCVHDGDAGLRLREEGFAIVGGGGKGNSGFLRVKVKGGKGLTFDRAAGRDVGVTRDRHVAGMLVGEDLGFGGGRDGDGVVRWKWGLRCRLDRASLYRLLQGPRGGRDDGDKALLLRCKGCMSIAITSSLVVKRFDGVWESVVADENIGIEVSHLGLRCCESYVSIYCDWRAALVDGGEASPDESSFVVAEWLNV